LTGKARDTTTPLYENIKIKPWLTGINLPYACFLVHHV
jgi:hypothetical protein